MFFRAFKQHTIQQFHPLKFPFELESTRELAKLQTPILCTISIFSTSKIKWTQLLRIRDHWLYALEIRIFEYL